MEPIQRSSWVTIKTEGTLIEMSSYVNSYFSDTIHLESDANVPGQYNLIVMGESSEDYRVVYQDKEYKLLEKV